MWLKYPKMNSILKEKELTPFLKTPLYFEVKRDGSNISLQWDKENKEIIIYSRNGRISDKKLEERVRSTIESILPNLIKLWKNLPEEILYGEFIHKGKSPAGFEYHDSTDYLIFDIWDTEEKDFVPPSLKYLLLKAYKLPYIEPLSVISVNTVEELLDMRNKILQEAIKQGYEGVVIKCVDQLGNYRLFKEKAESKIIRKLRPKDKEPVLPMLPVSEIMGAVDKAYWELGDDKFRDKKVALPKIAKLVKEEAIKHECTAPRNIYPYYLKYLEKLARGS